MTCPACGQTDPLPHDCGTDCPWTLCGLCAAVYTPDGDWYRLPWKKETR